MQQDIGECTKIDLCIKLHYLYISIYRNNGISLLFDGLHNFNG